MSVYWLGVIIFYDIVDFGDVLRVTVVTLIVLITYIILYNACIFHCGFLNECVRVCIHIHTYSKKAPIINSIDYFPF